VTATDTTDTADTADKRFATVRARLALRGWMLAVTAGGDYLATRWGMVRWLDDLDDVERFAARIGA